MRIALVVPDDLTTVLFCKHIIKGLQTIPNAEVIVICTVDQFRNELEAFGVEVKHLNIPRTISPVGDSIYILKLLSFFKIRKVDMVFNVIAAKQNIYGSIAAKMAGIDQIYSWVNGLGQAFTDSPDQKRIRIILMALYKFIFRFNKKVWFNNPADMALFLEAKSIHPSKTYLSRFFLDVDDYTAARIPWENMEYASKKLNLAPDERVVIMVARMLVEKGVKEFCNAAIEIYKQNPKIRFLLVAPLEPNHINSVPESYIRQIQESSNLTWTNFEKDVRPFYHLADLAVLPSYYKEGGYPRALSEPMAMGKPIITTDTDGCRATVENGLNGFLIPPRDSHALAEAILRIMNDDDMRENMCVYAREKALRDFDESTIVPIALREMGLIIK